MSSKETTLTVRIDEALKKAFLEVCADDDLTGSQMIRRYMRDMVEKRQALKTNHPSFREGRQSGASRR